MALSRSTIQLRRMQRACSWRRSEWIQLSVAFRNLPSRRKGSLATVSYTRGSTQSIRATQSATIWIGRLLAHAATQCRSRCCSQCAARRSHDGNLPSRHQGQHMSVGRCIHQPQIRPHSLVPFDTDRPVKEYGNRLMIQAFPKRSRSRSTGPIRREQKIRDPCIKVLNR
jgi:hypothetical protein